MRRLDGVGHVEVSFGEGSAVVEAKENRGFDPTRIAAAIEGAGFDAREIRVEAVGTLVEHEERPALRFRDPPHLLILSEGGGLKGSMPFGPSWHRTVRVTGLLCDPPDEETAGIQVDEIGEVEDDTSPKSALSDGL
ncbi:MAG: heavy-metal-associated domain-containing protein [Thermoanaerobaculia bacterium]